MGRLIKFEDACLKYDTFGDALKDLVFKDGEFSREDWESIRDSNWFLCNHRNGTIIDERDGIKGGVKFGGVKFFLDKYKLNIYVLEKYTKDFEDGFDEFIFFEVLDEDWRYI